MSNNGNFAHSSVIHSDDEAQLPETAAHQPVTRVPTERLLEADSPRSSGESQEHVRMLAETQSELPPITVHRATMRVIDGMHRLRAARLRGQKDILVRFFDGEADDAFVLAVRANVAHGLPLSLGDRKAAAMRIVKSHPKWSDRLIASATGLAAKTVAEIRRLHGINGPKAEARIGKDGRLRRVDTTEQRRVASELIQESPHLSLRQVARVAGISPETARDVRHRLSIGEDPVHPNRRKRQMRDAKPPKSKGADDEMAILGRSTATRSAAGRHTLLRRLRADPSLRLAEAGRMLIRLLEIHAMSEEEWSRIIDSVPPHRREAIAHAALECARNWMAFADRLDRKP